MKYDSESQLFLGFQRKIFNGTCIYRLVCIEYTPDVLHYCNHLNRMKTNGMRGISVTDFYTYVSLVPVLMAAQFKA